MVSKVQLFSKNNEVPPIATCDSGFIMPSATMAFRATARLRKIERSIRSPLCHLNVNLLCNLLIRMFRWFRSFRVNGINKLD